MVKNIIKNVVSSNNLDQYIDESTLVVKVLYDQNLIMFFNFDNQFYITHKCLSLAENEEKKLALLICHELAHFLLDHNGRRVVTNAF